VDAAASVVHPLNENVHVDFTPTGTLMHVSRQFVKPQNFRGIYVFVISLAIEESLMNSWLQQSPPPLGSHTVAHARHVLIPSDAVPDFNLSELRKVLEQMHMRPLYRMWTPSPHYIAVEAHDFEADDTGPNPGKVS
jgi:hypothetical protein